MVIDKSTSSVLLDESVVNLVSLFGYWHLHRVLNGRHYFGHSDNRIGLTIRTEMPGVVNNWTPREFKVWISFTTKEGKLIEYWDEPYTEGQIKSFGNLTLEELEQWVERGT